MHHPQHLQRVCQDLFQIEINYEEEQAEHVYKAVANDKPVNPISVDSRIDELSKVVNPCTVGLRTDTDST